jgi:hypothetical protein
MPETTSDERPDRQRAAAATPDDRNRRGAEGRATGLDTGREPRGLQSGIAEHDCRARSGSAKEPLRNTPPAGAWNDISHD